MFKALDGRKRRVISPATLAASVGAHVLLLGGVVYAAAHDPRPPREQVDIMVLPPLPVEPVAPVKPPAPPPPPEAPAPPDAPRPVVGEVLQVHAPVEVPNEIAPEPVGIQPVDPNDYRRDGVIGDVIGTPDPLPAEPTGNTDPGPAGPDFVPDLSMVEEGPVLNRSGLPRTMERYYPPVLRDSRVGGRVVIELVVDADGRVRANSARVVEASHPAFAEATLRALERFRFRPAKMAGVPVPVRVTIPINWTVPR